MTDRYATMERQATLAAKAAGGSARVHRCGGENCGRALQPIAQKNGVDYYAGLCGECADRVKPARAPGGA